ncbi:hypothetical protein [Aeromonas sp. R1-2]|uniref:hypothetical protein n=1 Tax=Aeromonas sp. R1-2 TaxID=3138456 RepID=UPI0034A2C658
MVKIAFRALIWLTLLLLLVMIVFFPLHFYYSEFGLLSKYSFQNNQTWGNFGSFIGGTVGSALSFFTVIGVLYTYNLQQKQLDIANSQKKLGELQPLLNSTTLRIDAILDKDVDDIIHNIIPCEKNRKIWSVYFCLMYFGGNRSGKVTQNEIDAIKSNLKIEIAVLCQEAENLSYLIEKVELITKDETTREFYNFRYGRAFKNMYDTNCDILERTIYIFGLDRDQ